MKLLVTFFGLLATAFAMDPCMCNRMWDPVCGSDGMTYGNPCMLTCEKATHNPGLTMIHEGNCNNAVKALKSNPCMCNRMWDPVCGSDGMTYGNPCMLTCEKATHNPGLTMIHEGNCNNAVKALKSKPCICNKMWDPLCGTDGKTYGNKCMFNCAKAEQKSDLEIFHQGECDIHVPDVVPCVCDRTYDPVCGSDGVTYPNACEFSCSQTKKNPGLIIVNYGECTESTFVEKSAPCICTMNYLPVCGSDGVTYGNLCGLQCELKTNPSLRMAYEGECTQDIALEALSASCSCNNMYRPVCGSDGVTYRNPCMLKCQKNHGHPNLVIVKQGPC